MNRAKSSKLLVQRGAPACVHDNRGNSALSLLIEKLPDVAIVALNQFHSTCIINRKEFFFLNYLGKCLIGEMFCKPGRMNHRLSLKTPQKLYEAINRFYQIFFNMIAITQIIKTQTADHAETWVRTTYKYL